jgi:prepilin-type N-terminal cleavage/methylation domain-containing protein
VLLALRRGVTARARLSRRLSGDAGFTLIEALAAVLLLAIAAAAVAQLLVMAWQASSTTGQLAIAQQIAREKMEQLRALPWTADGGVPVSDWSSDLTVTPVVPSGGTGLGVSPRGALLTDMQGYCDFVGPDGRWLAGGDRAPAGAAWVRRWAIEELQGVSDTLLLQVVVVSANRKSNSSGVTAMKGANGVRLLAIRTRVSR